MRARNTLLIIIIIIAVLGIGISTYKLITISNSYKEAKDTYKLVDDMFTEQETDDEEDASTVTDKRKIKTTWKWNYQKMLEMCPDTVGYIKQEKTLSYPVLQAENNEKYLRHMYDGTYNIAGSLFVDCSCTDGLDTPYAVIYGHNMDDGSMFGTITRYKDEEYYKKHPTFEVYAKDKYYRYYVFSAFQAEADGYVFCYGMTGDQLLQQALALKSECAYQTNAPELTADSHILVLSTCIDYPRDYAYRWVVCLVRGEEIKDEETQDTDTTSQSAESIQH